MIVINQGKPDSPYFGVLQTENAGLLKIGTIVSCIHPRLQTKTNARVHAVYTYAWTDFPDTFFLILFGYTVAEYRKAICRAFPEFKDSNIIKVFILIELNSNQPWTSPK